MGLGTRPYTDCTDQSNKVYKKWPVAYRRLGSSGEAVECDLERSHRGETKELKRE